VPGSAGHDDGGEWRRGLRAALDAVAPEDKLAAVGALNVSALAASAASDPRSETFDWPAPAMRSRPALLAPTEMPRRRLGTAAGRAALLHAVAHIELNAVDLALDMAGRFAGVITPSARPAFVADWLGVAQDEARHFALVTARLAALGTAYGDLPAHAALWEAAERTRADLLARLAIAPLVLEARGLDVSPDMIGRLDAVGDVPSADCLRVILEEEVGHVAHGRKWFVYVCSARGLAPAETFAAAVRGYFPAGLRAPFNYAARRAAGMPDDWYEGLAAG
jgi:uncharacterized ferritin-like protein (DUF455 family)